MKKLIALLCCCCCLAVSSANAASGQIVVKKAPAGKQAKPPALPAVSPTAFRAPDVRRVVSDGGIEAWLIEEKSTPVIAVSVLFKGGKAADPARLTGLSSLAAALLDEGAGRYPAERFTEILSEKAIGLSFETTADFFRADMETLRKNKEDGFDLLRLSLTRPRFDRKAVRRMKEQMYAGIKARKGDPNAVAAERWAKLVYKDHPYGRMTPTERSVRLITRANLRGWVRDRIARDNMIVGVAGNISAEELKPLLDKAFAALPAKSRVRETPPFVPELSDKTDVLTMDVPQSAALFGHRGIARNDPDFYAALLVNYSFGGGGFASRLFDEVREKRGLAYSVGTSLSIAEAAPMLTGAIGSDNAKMAGAIEIIREQWDKMAQNGPDEQELRDAKTYLTGAFPLAFTSGGGAASYLTGMQYYGLGIDYLNRHNDLIDAVTLQQAQDVAARMFDAGSLFFVVVGKPANL